MALVLILFVLIIAMGCGALACRLIMADDGHAHYVDTVNPSSRSPAPALVGDAVDRPAAVPEQELGQLIYFTRHAPEGYVKIGEPAGVPAP